MNGLVFACIAPHGSMVIPLLGEKDAGKALATRAAMEELGRRVAAAQPETIVLVTPHGHRIDHCFSLLNNRRVQGTLEGENESSGNSFTLSFEVDRELNSAIVEEAHALDVPVSRVYFAVDNDTEFYMPLDWGALVPLWFMGATLNSRPKVVIACPDRGNMPWSHFVPFGMAIRNAAQKSSTGAWSSSPAPTWDTRMTRRGRMATIVHRRSLILPLWKRSERKI